MSHRPHIEEIGHARERRRAGIPLAVLDAVEDRHAACVGRYRAFGVELAKNNLIFEANKPMLTSPDKIYPGQVLRIPPLS
ncbi:hypothetical protein DAI43_32535 [Achromobacter xylosoxidans]|nr:hypothetical protein DAI43_32535 [Achromobacter xylosoxidans]